MTVVPLPAAARADNPPRKGDAPDLALEIRGLGKVYKGSGHGEGTVPPKVALKDITLDVPRGAFFGLLGPNGAGKSTLINILAGLVDKTSGQARIWGYDIDHELSAAKMAIGVVPQELNIDPFFTPKQLLDLQSGLYGLKRSEYRTWELLEALGLTDKAHAYTRALSGGMRRRLLIGKAILHSPPIVVLDEPTAGVDVELRQHLWNYMRALNEAGTTILLTTHYLEEAEKLCDTIAIIDEGELIACEPTADLVGRIDHKEMIVTVDRELDCVPPSLIHFEVKMAGPQRLVFGFKRSQSRMAEILDAIRGAGLTISDISTSEGRLEDVFLQLTGSRQKQSPYPDSA
jgi:ABC-2 type transport system ATP-binding protein